MNFAQTCWLKAHESLGVQEEPIGSNWGRYIKIYLAFVSIFSPAAWCAAFVLFKVYQAAQIAGVSISFPKTGSCSTLAAWAKRNGRLSVAPVGEVCLFLVRGRDKSGDFIDGLYQHIGFYRSDDSATVEGNSNDDGSAEGYEVVERERPVSDRYHYIRL